jgi:hypothetical protein
MIDPEVLDEAFQEFMMQLQKCINGNGEYAE